MKCSVWPMIVEATVEGFSSFSEESADDDETERYLLIEAERTDCMRGENEEEVEEIERKVWAQTHE